MQEYPDLFYKLVDHVGLERCLDYASSVLITTERYTSAVLALSQSWYFGNGIVIFKILGRHHWHFWLCGVSSHRSLRSPANDQRNLLTIKRWCTGFYDSIAQRMRLEGSFGDHPGQPPCSKEGQVEQAVLCPLFITRSNAAILTLQVLHAAWTS